MVVKEHKTTRVCGPALGPRAWRDRFPFPCTSSRSPALPTSDIQKECKNHAQLEAPRCQYWRPQMLRNPAWPNWRVARQLVQTHRAPAPKVIIPPDSLRPSCSHIRPAKEEWSRNILKNVLAMAPALQVANLLAFALTHVAPSLCIAPPSKRADAHLRGGEVRARERGMGRDRRPCYVQHHLRRGRSSAFLSCVLLLSSISHPSPHPVRRPTTSFSALAPVAASHPAAYPRTVLAPVCPVACSRSTSSVARPSSRTTWSS